MAGYTNNGGNYDFALARYNSNGSLDTSFDSDGKLTTSIGTGNDFALGMVLQSDGKIVVVGRSNNGSNDDFALARYNANGSLDTSFSGDGKQTTPFGSGDDAAFSVAVQADGKIVVAGYSDVGGGNFDFALARYDVSGNLDTGNFGTPGNLTGKLTTPIGTGSDTAAALALQADGKIVLAGRSHSGSSDLMALARYTTTGALDSSFDGDGKLTASLGNIDNYAKRVAIQSDTKIVVGGYTGDGNATYNFALARFDASGAADNTFDGDGKLTTVIPSGTSFAYAMAIQTDGKIVLAGYVDKGSDRAFALARYRGEDTRPEAVSQTAVVLHDTNKSILLTGTDADGDILAFEITQAPNHGTLTGTGANRTYTPQPGYVGGDTFTFRVNDGVLNSYQASMVLNVVGAQLIVAFSTASQTVSEIAGLVEIVGTLNAPAALDLSIPVQVSGTAANGKDFQLLDGNLFFAAGSTSGSVSLGVIDDARYEGTTPKTVVLTLQPPDGVQSGSLTQHTLSISDDDPLPLVSLSRGAVTAAEGEAIRLEVQLSAESDVAVTVPLTFSGSATANSDYSVAESSIFIPAGADPRPRPSPSSMTSSKNRRKRLSCSSARPRAEHSRPWPRAAFASHHDSAQRRRAGELCLGVPQHARRCHD